MWWFGIIYIAENACIVTPIVNKVCNNTLLHIYICLVGTISPFVCDGWICDSRNGSGYGQSVLIWCFPENIKTSDELCENNWLCEKLHQHTDYE